MCVALAGLVVGTGSIVVAGTLSLGWHFVGFRKVLKGVWKD